MAPRGVSREFLRFPTRLRQLAVRFLGKAEIVGALDGNFLCDFEDLAKDVEIVFLRFFVRHAVARKSSDHAVVSARGKFPNCVVSACPSRSRARKCELDGLDKSAVACRIPRGKAHPFFPGRIERNLKMVLAERW